MDIGVDDIRTWHVRDNGWDDVGYHHVIKRDGTVEKGREHDVIGAHAKGMNTNSLGEIMFLTVGSLVLTLMFLLGPKN